MALVKDSNYRYVILTLATLCLSMMLANILTLNFTILCMNGEKSRLENFTIDLGIDVFEKIDSELRAKPTDSPSRYSFDG